MLESTPRSPLYHAYNRRYERSCKKVFDLDFQGHAIKIEFFHYHRWIPWPRKHTHEKYFGKIRTGRPKSRGGWYPPPPLGRPKVDFYLGHLRVNIHDVPFLTHSKWPNNSWTVLYSRLPRPVGSKESRLPLWSSSFDMHKIRFKGPRRWSRDHVTELLQNLGFVGSVKFLVYGAQKMLDRWSIIYLLG